MSRTRPCELMCRNSGTFPQPGCLVTRSSVNSSREGGLAGRHGRGRREIVSAVGNAVSTFDHI